MDWPLIFAIGCGVTGVLLWHKRDIRQLIRYPGESTPSGATGYPTRGGESVREGITTDAIWHNLIYCTLGAGFLGAAAMAGLLKFMGY
jgi:hypothetical protein